MSQERISAKLLFLLLMGIGFCLPAFNRQPTHTLIALSAVVAIWHVVVTAAWRRWDGADYAMTALLCSAIISNLTNWRTAVGVSQGVFEWLAYWSSFMAIRHSAIAPARLRSLAVTLVAGGLIGLVLAVWDAVQTSRSFELPGVRGTIRSSLYVGMLLVLSIGFSMTCRGWKRLTWLGIALLLAAALLALSSRAVIIASCLALAVAFWWFSRRQFVALIAVSLTVAVIAWSFLPLDQKSRFAYKTRELVELVGKGRITANDEIRIETWRVAWAWIRRGEHISFGIGPRSFHLIDTEKLNLHPPLVHQESKQMSHAHNLFLTIYIEQGVFGLAALLAFIGMAIWRLWKCRQMVRIEWSWWGAWAALVLILVNGMVGSPWSREYAWLASTLIAIHFARSSPSPKPITEPSQGKS